MMTVTTFEWVPEPNQGYVKDLRVRWALEEAKLPYQVKLVNGKDIETEEYMHQQPFGQVPVLQDGNFSLFESGAIALYIGEKSEALLPKDPLRKSRVTAWLIAALNSIEPYSRVFIEIDEQANKDERDQIRWKEAKSELGDRLAGLSFWLKDHEYLETTFSVADILMATVLRELSNPGILVEYPLVKDYVNRCLARPCFQKAHTDQMKLYTKK